MKEKGEHIPLAKLKLLKADPAEVQAQSEEIKARYTRLLECERSKMSGRARSGAP